MPVEWLGFCVGLAFGAALFLAGLADPDKIIGTLRLKDFHAMRTIAVFVLTSMAGTWVLGLLGWAHIDLKPALMLPVALGGALLGIGFGLTGYCPGTGLACAASGRFDALVAVVGMLLGALCYILVYPLFVPAMEAIYNYGKVTLPEITHVNPILWVGPMVVVGALVLWLTRPRKPKTEPPLPMEGGDYM